MRFAYARRGGPLLDWSGPTPPYPTRAGETRSLGEFYPTTRNSSALRRYGGRSPQHGGAAVGYEHHRDLGAWPAVNVDCKMSARSMGAVALPRPGAPEVIEGYEEPAPGAATIHLGEECTWDIAHRRAHGMSGYIPEGSAVRYGGQMLGAEAPAFDKSLIRKAAVLASAYHGVKRHNGSVLWGLLWAAAAYVTPVYGVLVPAIGVAQGYGRAKP